MKFLLFLVTLSTSLLAQAYECKGVDSSGNVFKVKTYIEGQEKYITLQSSPVIYAEPVKLKTFQGSSMGHSRCPGTWSGFTLVGQNSQSSFKSLSIVTDEHFYGCGFAPSDSLTISQENKTEIIHLSCKI